MFLRQTLEDSIQKNENLIRELEIVLGKLEADISQNFKELGISRAELEAYFNNRDNFSDDEWAEVVRVKGEINQRLHSGNTLASVKRVKEARAGLPKDGRWIHVR